MNKERRTKNEEPSTIKHRPPSSGFSLVEVTLAVLLVGAGITLLFSLFPAGLRQSEMGIKDTHLGMFADTVFSGIRAEASTIVDADDWDDIDRFRIVAVAPVTVGRAPDQHNVQGDNTERTVQNLVAPGMHVSYRLDVSGVSGRPNLRYASLRANIGASFNAADAQWFYTEFFYSGVE